MSGVEREAFEKWCALQPSASVTTEHVLEGPTSMTPEQQTPASVVERLTDPNFAGPMQHLRNWSELDRLHTEAASLIERLSAEREGLREALERIKREDIHHEGDDVDNYDPALGHSSRSWLGPFGRIARAALTQGESRQTGANHDRGISEEPIGDGRFIYRTTLMGERHVVDAATGFVWFKLPYDYRYTSNAGQRRTAEAIINALAPLPAAPTPADGGGE